ncbi:putative nuclease HARBI1 [Photinus pyralis]|nr:putative nuclease HARBI1 [Photinus pyralis]
MESIRSVANRFGISNSTCWMVLYKICNMLVQLSLQHRLIAWPSPNSLQVTCNSFQQHFGMRGVIGAIDGSHIRINAPKDHHTSYINRKGYHSVLLQAVCNADMLFTDVYTGYPGSVHDAALFKRSDLCNNISTGAAYVGEFYLLGDKAYPLQTVLMVPFKDTGRLSRQQKHFNVVLSKSRVVIENAFALLKGRFRRLKYIETVKLEYIVLLIMAATILHNLCILCKDEFRQLIDITVEIAEEREMNDVEIHNIAFRNNLAIAKRQEIMNSLAMILNN